MAGDHYSTALRHPYCGQTLVLAFFFFQTNEKTHLGESGGWVAAFGCGGEGAECPRGLSTYKYM